MLQIDNIRACHNLTFFKGQMNQKIDIFYFSSILVKYV